LNLLPPVATLRFAERFEAAAQHHELAANPADGLANVFPEVGYGLQEDYVDEERTIHLRPF
jgi:hypothetical protein